MTRGKGLSFCLALGGAVMLAVSSLGAQASPDDPPRVRVQRDVVRLDVDGARIGVTIEDMTTADLEAAGGGRHGVRITGVEADSPAAEAGLQKGDLVVSLDGNDVRSARQFSRLVRETAPSRSVALGIVRGGQRQTIEVTPEERSVTAMSPGLIDRDVERRLREIEPRLREIEPRLRELEPRLREFAERMPHDFDFDIHVNPDVLVDPDVRIWRGGFGVRGRLGLQLQELTPQLADYFGVKEGGVLIATVTADSSAAKAGLEAGDVIIAANGKPVRRGRDLVEAMREVETGLTLGIVRDRKEMTVTATLEATPTRQNQN